MKKPTNLKVEFKKAYSVVKNVSERFMSRKKRLKKKLHEIESRLISTYENKDDKKFKDLVQQYFRIEDEYNIVSSMLIKFRGVVKEFDNTLKIISAIPSIKDLGIEKERDNLIYATLDLIDLKVLSSINKNLHDKFDMGRIRTFLLIERIKEIKSSMDDLKKELLEEIAQERKQKMRQKRNERKK